MRKDLSRMEEWAKDWKMLFNVDKYSVMHMGKGKQEVQLRHRGSHFESLGGRKGPRHYHVQPGPD